jgi:hypothetical protein
MLLNEEELVRLPLRMAFMTRKKINKKKMAKEINRKRIMLSEGRSDDSQIIMTTTTMTITTTRKRNRRNLNKNENINRIMKIMIINSLFLLLFASFC